MQRLSEQWLKTHHPESLRNPDVAPKIVHLGIGAFHRAHQAVYTHQANLRHPQDPWFIMGVSLRSNTVSEQLSPQQGYYSVLQSDVNGTEVDVVSSVCGVLVAKDEQEKVIEYLSAESTQIISLTVTEKGYCHDPATGKLNQQHPDVIHDMQNLNTPKSALGYVVRALQLRMAQDRNNLTVVCCDNLPDNGTTLKGLVTEFAGLVDANLERWIKQNIAFPNTMVDRIVPATTSEDIDDLSEKQGYLDNGMVKTEAFTQWVIEDNFSSDKPDWQGAGALLVEDVEPFELAKLRLLNGSHSALAYAGYLSGHQYVHQVMQNERLTGFIKTMMLTEIVPTLSAPAGLNLEGYCQQLLTRFSNPALWHKTYQIAMDGSQKLPQRLLNTIKDRIDANQSISCLTFAVAAWLRYTAGVDEAGQHYQVQDPIAEQLSTIWAHQSAEGIVEAALAIHQVFPQELASSQVFKASLTNAVENIFKHGIEAALENI